jgi:hypothetical protein
MMVMTSKILDLEYLFAACTAMEKQYELIDSDHGNIY